MIKNIILKLGYFFKIADLFYFFNRNRQIILTYHNILPDNLFDDSPHLLVSMKESVFRKQIKIIKKRFNITTKIGVPNSCIITFDDGYLNNFLIAHKILEEENIKAIFFLPLLEETLWIDKILLWISYVPNGLYNILSEKISIKNTKLSRMQALEKIYNYLLEKKYEPEKLISELNYNFPFNKIELNPYVKKIRFERLNEKHINIMKNFGHIIAAHSIKHDILSRLPKEKLIEDFNFCQQNINNLYNSTFYAYPFGSEKEVDEKVISVFKDTLFSYGFMNINYPKYSYSKEALPRMMLLPKENKKFEIECRLSGLIYFLKYKKLFPKISDFYEK